MYAGWYACNSDCQQIGSMVDQMEELQVQVLPLLVVVCW